MKHLGNISKINVAEAETVDVVIGGSPCQDLSIAGKRAGLDGARSGLFMEQIRICREMRERDRAAGRAGIDVRPRFCVWENVPGALSSNDGEDFRIVLEEFCKVADPSATVPRPPKGKWKSAGCIVGDGYSVAWRIMDARYYGVPQRRRRISLVADFAGGCAPQILFDEQGMCWNLETSQKAWQGITGHAAGSVGGSGCDWGCKCLNPEDPQSKILFEVDGSFHSLYAGECGGGNNDGVCYSIEGNTVDRASNKNGKGFSEDVSATLNTQDKHAVCYAPLCYPKVTGSLCARADSSPCLDRGQPFVVEKCGCFMGGQGSAAGGIGYSEQEAPTLKSVMSGGNTVPEVVYDARGNGDGKTVCTITGDHCDRITDYTPLVLATAQGGAEVGKNESPCLMAGHERPIVSAIDCINMKQVGDVSGTLCAKKAGYSLNYQNPVVYTAKTRRKYIVRRLTPMECSRLQGLPDDFADVPAYEDVSDGELDFWREVLAEWAEINGKKPKTDKQIRKWLQAPISESNQYQIYGNGIALPQWVWVLGRISEKLGKGNPTMASLFDGSGSFPLIWEAINGKGTAVWSSEVNPEAIRVSRYRIGGDAPC
jgi:DNA (cytosine-5)-methyltransferase 1